MRAITALLLLLSREVCLLRTEDDQDGFGPDVNELVDGLFGTFDLEDDELLRDAEGTDDDD